MATNNQEIFGCDIESFVDKMKESALWRFSGKDATITSILSNVQELMLLGELEEARQLINIVKYIVNTEV